jgi:chromosome condensin MukBEF ATPase and DNA-binding subunit MukB
LAVPALDVEHVDAGYRDGHEREAVTHALRLQRARVFPLNDVVERKAWHFGHDDASQPVHQAQREPSHTQR